MPQFYNKKSNYYIITNYKVMWSTLIHQKDLKKVKNTYFIFLQILEKLKLRQKKDCYFLTRNPYSRLESFYKDKLKKSMDPGPLWPRSHRIFFSLLGISKKTSGEEIVQKLRAITFSEFIHFLPRIYKMDKHLHPQTSANKYIVGHQKIKRILKLENVEHIDFIRHQLNIDLSIRKNSTQHINADISWNKELYSIVNKIYLTDFEYFGYQPIN